MKKFLIPIILAITLLISVVAMLLALKGKHGNPTAEQLLTKEWRENGVFELSPERGRYALTYSIIEDKSVHFSEHIARFAVPDVAEYQGKYVSLFAPAVSYIIVPGYLLGKSLGVAQVGSVAVIALFGILNGILIYLVARALNIHKIAAILGGLTFLFATPAFAYGVNIYQHHVSTFLILLAIYLYIKFKSAWSSAVIFLLCGTSVAVDYPNFFFMMPIGLATVTRAFSIKFLKNKAALKLNVLHILAAITIALPLLFLFNFQNESYGSPLRLAGSVATAKFDQDKEDLASIPLEELTGEATPKSRDKNVLTFFQTRGIVNALYLHFVSPDRGMLTFTPIILVGFLGLVLAYRKNVPHFQLLCSTVLAIFVLYALWGDPWGGWAFGTRYLVPAYAILAMYVAYVLSLFRKNIFVLVVYLGLMTYSLFVNTVGALTTIAMPPQVEVLALEELSGQIQRYSYDRGMYMLDQNLAKSYVFDQYFSDHFSAWEYFFIVLAPLVILTGGLVVALRWIKE